MAGHIGSIRTPPKLFAAAMSQSGDGGAGQFSRLDQAMDYGETFKSRTGCNHSSSAEVLRCVRALPWNVSAEVMQSTQVWQQNFQYSQYCQQNKTFSDNHSALCQERIGAAAGQSALPPAGFFQNVIAYQTAVTTTVSNQVRC